MACVATLALVAAGCGGSGQKPKPKPKESPAQVAVSKVIRGYLTALAQGDGPTACRLMTARQRSQVIAGAPGNCNAILSSLAYSLSSGEKQTLQNAAIQSVKFSGDDQTATVAVRGQKGAATLVKQNGHWLINGGVGG